MTFQVQKVISFKQGLIKINNFCGGNLSENVRLNISYFRK